MNMSATIKSILIAAFAAGAVVACSGGGTTTAEGGIGGTGISTGTVTGTASICQNGVEYLISGNTQLIIEDNSSAAENEYQIGMVTEIEFDDSTVTNVNKTCDDGTVSGVPVTQSANATKVTYHAELRGPVTTAAAAGGMSFEVMGQLVITDTGTRLLDSTGAVVSSLDNAAFGVNTIVEVSGHRAVGGTILATLVRVDNSGAEARIRGFADNIGATSITVGNATVNCPLPCELPNGLVTGNLVEAEGTFTVGSMTLNATTVTLDDNIYTGAEGDEVEYEGLVTNAPDWTAITPPIPLPQEIQVDGKTVVIDSATSLEGGVLSNLVVNTRIEAEGILDVGATKLLADKIEFRGNSFGIQAVLDANGTATAIQLLGITVKVNELTEVRDQSTTKDPSLTVAGLQIGNYVEIEGVLQPDGITLLAKKIDRKDPSADTVIEGPITGIGTDTLEILAQANLTIQITVLTNIVADDGTTIPFSNLAVGNVVEAKGTYDTINHVLTAEEVELED